MQNGYEALCVLNLYDHEDHQNDDTNQANLPLSPRSKNMFLEMVRL